MLFGDGIAAPKNLIEQLREAIKQSLPRLAIEIRGNVIDDLRQYIDGQKVYDEITLVEFKQK